MRAAHFCPKCGKHYKHERICPTCHRVLVDERPDLDAIDAPAAPPSARPDTGGDHYGFTRDDGQSVTESVFQTKDMGLLPLATMALDSADIHYIVHGGAGSNMFGMPQGVELHVRPADAPEARRVLEDLERAGDQGVGAFEPGDQPPAETVDANVATPPDEAGPPQARVELIDTESGRPVTSVTLDQLEWLARRLQRDAQGSYYVDTMTIDMLEGEDADADLVEALRRASAGRDGVDLRPASEPLFDQRTARPEPRRVEATIALLDTQDDRRLGVITEGHAVWLGDRLDPEPTVFGKPDYCIDGDVIADLKADGADADLLDTLRTALGGRDEMFVRW
jgi:hypothetical protein